MKWIVRRIGLLVVALGCLQAQAGFVELGASANYRYSGYSPTNYIQSLTYTGSFAYYFLEMCALELNYTTGYSKQVSGGTAAIDPKQTIEDNIQMTSLDLVLSFAGRQDPFRPYVKAGAGYLIKERFRQINDDNNERIAKQEGVVPSGGLGLAINLTQTLSIKVGLDAWTSPLRVKPVIVDYAGRAGISWMF